MTNPKLVLSVGLAAAALAVALTFFAGSVLLFQPWFAQLVVQGGLDREWFAQVFIVSAIMLSTAAFVVSWNQRSFLVAGLLAASGIIFMIHPRTTIFMMHSQTAIGGHSAVMADLGPILGLIIGLIMLGLGVAKGIRTAGIAVTTVK